MRRCQQQWVKYFLVGFVCLGMGGCSLPGRRPLTLGQIGSAPPATSSQTSTQPSTYDDSSWRALLLKHVGPGWTSVEEASRKDRGPAYPALVDYKAILAAPVELNAYLAILAQTGPTSTPEPFPTQAQQLAYYINAYNACAIRAVLAEYPAATMYGPRMPQFEYEWYFQVDGGRMNLHDLREMAWRAADGDVRTLFATCSCAIGACPLASSPYEPASVYDDMAAHMRDCLAMPQIVTVSHDRQQLQLWARIIQYRKDFSSWYKKLYGTMPETLLNVILDLCPPSQRQTLNKAVGYKVVAIPFDRRLNDLVVRADGPAMPRGQ